jgi:beta-lactamase superfamily II metal-dependent hydrolase
VSLPTVDEVEVTLFGRGTGECLVVHLGGEWLVIDSHLNGRAPAAEVYLSELGVDPSAVKALIVTHFHSDHYRGIDRLLDAYPEARLMVTEALQTEEFEQLYGDEGEEPLLGAIPATVHRARRRVLHGGSPGFRALKVGALVHQNLAGKVLALSPSEAAVQASATGVASALATGDRHLTVKQLKDDNRCAVVLHVESFGFGALLTADLVNDSAGFGWTALLGEPLNAAVMASDLLKAPHHGSSGADHPDMWSRLVAPEPDVTVTPYWSSALPRPSDVTRLADHAGRLWQAAPSLGSTIDEFGNRISSPPVTGRIRARRSEGEPAWRVETDGAAFQVS